jgi:hypothetical protein
MDNVKIQITEMRVLRQLAEGARVDLPPPAAERTMRYSVPLGVLQNVYL